MKGRMAIATYLVSLLAVPVVAQTAKQGTDADRGATEFRSPMVLETTVAEEGDWWKLGRFFCDGVSLRGEREEGFFWDRPKTEQWQPGLTMKMRDLPGGKVEVTFGVSVNNRKHNHDKVADVRLEIVNGDEIVATETARIKAQDDGDDHGTKIKTVLPSREAIKPTTKLRLTMTTKDY